MITSNSNKRRKIVSDKLLDQWEGVNSKPVRNEDIGLAALIEKGMKTENVSRESVMKALGR